MITKISPGFTSKLTFFSTERSPKLFDRPSTLTLTASASAPVNGLRVLLQLASRDSALIGGYMSSLVTK